MKNLNPSLFNSFISYCILNCFVFFQSKWGFKSSVVDRVPCTVLYLIVTKILKTVKADLQSDSLLLFLLLKQCNTVVPFVVNTYSLCICYNQCCDL